MSDAAELDAGLAGLGLALAAAQQRQLLEFAALLRKWNRTVNLISRRDERRIVPRHLLDSLVLVPWLVGERIADLGCGAGLPGLPLAIACPDRSFTLIDRSERRTRFVRQAAIELALANVDVVTAGFAGYRPGRGFDTVISRAVDRPEQIWRVARALLGGGPSRAVLQCGKDGGAARFDGAARARFVRAPVPGLPDNHYLWVLEPAA